MLKKIARFRPSLNWNLIGNILKETFWGELTKNNGRTNQFEKKFANYIGVQNAITVPSGRIGLYLILKHLGFKEKAEVLVPAFTYWAIPRIISILNLCPVFVNIDPQTCNLDVSLIEEKITKHTKAILPTHLYGLPCEMDFIQAIARKYNLFVIEDCVQACGAEYKGKKLGSIGDASYFSFDITKNFSLMGGGMVVTNDDALAESIRKDTAGYDFLNRLEIFKKAGKVSVMKILTHPMFFSFCLFPLIYLFGCFGIDIVHNIFSEKKDLSIGTIKNYLRLLSDEIQSKAGPRGLKYLDNLIDKRIKNGHYLLEHLKEERNVTLPLKSGKNIFTNFPIRSAQRDLLAKELLKRGVDTSKGYMEAFGDCPRAKTLVEEILHLPVYPFLKEPELSYICKAVKDSCRKLGL